MPQLPVLPKLRIAPEGRILPVSRLRHGFYVLSALAIIASTVMFFLQGLNYGIDFKGGTLIEAQSPAPISLAPVRRQLASLNLGDVQVQHFGSEEEILIRIEAQADSTSAEPSQRAVALVRQTLGNDYAIRRVEVVGPQVSRELVTTGVLSVLAALMLVLIYIWARFEWQFSLGAVAALVHDVVLTIGIFSLLRFEFNLAIVAAILTIVGYSLNDTVVVYDRVRENLRKYRKMTLADLIDFSVAQTLSRTLMTSVTTLLALGALYVFGGPVIEGFTFAMIWGVITGTYSSIFVASPILLALGVRRDWGSQN